ncbi:MAG: beta-ketoacyl synthase N-terminal-like domain-containing protein [Bacillota bacterium]|nr:beta-ketoacyl synthase N-terminal-like domain-containing protein [Bacillota bacterium]
MESESTRVVVTGVGAVSALGPGAEALRSGLEGGAAAGRVEEWDGLGRLAVARAADFEPERFLPPRTVRNNERFTHLAAAAAELALEQAGLDPAALDPWRVGVIGGTSVGGPGELIAGLERVQVNGPRRVGPHTIPRIIPNMAAGVIAERYGFRGVNTTLTTASGAGLDAIGTAAFAVRDGEADVVLAGASESSLEPLLLAPLLRTGELSRERGRPYDARRDGVTAGEGAAWLVLESLAHARARGARILAEVAGYGRALAAGGQLDGRTLADGLARAIRAALEDAGLGPEAVDGVVAHAAGSPRVDRAEAQALRAVLGPALPPVTAPAGALGYTMAASGALEAAVAALALAGGKLPPTAGWEEADPDLELVPVHGGPLALEGRRGRPHLLCTAIGLGGPCSALLLAGWS